MGMSGATHGFWDRYKPMRGVQGLGRRHGPEGFDIALLKAGFVGSFQTALEDRFAES